ncbi:AraC family transcriptional regulator [uncultured Roseovarius sp.]|uniref:helix-turn-helix transcriptional regulator n=1 Tax=uncultured Roseovarius sp. TaxID=293344 RepID=UPI00262FC28D|nr:AraC family transcriptional regulator [uncultured Roseovarius sp.]
MHENLSETHIVGENTHQRAVRAEDCPALAHRLLSHVGVGDAAPPYRVVRTNLSGACLHACLGGEGRMLLDGRWRLHRAGMVTLAPAHVLHAFHAVPGKRWQYCWVRYTPQSPRSAIEGMTPLVAQVDPKPLSDAILGLYHEVNSSGDIAAAALWIDLIEHDVKRYTEPLRNEERLSKLWAEVTAELGRPWTLDQLAAIAGLSGEHLRRLCQTRLGRSPMQQLTCLRVQQAAQLLATTDTRVEDVAFAVGYQNPFAFSNAFKRMTGFRPSRFQRGRTLPEPDEVQS